MDQKGDWFSKPGDTIVDLLNERCMPIWEFAKKSGLSFSEAVDLIDGKIAITTEVARGLEAAFGAPASFWLQRDSNYRKKISCS
jgi:HTH-type transcriptional regulator/antitoxin HigA